MKAIFWTRQEIGHKPVSDHRETNLAKALQQAALKCGDEIDIRIKTSKEPVVEDCDLMCMCGVKNRNWFDAYSKAGIPWAYFDKGYTRTRADIQWLDFWRTSVNSHHPIAFLSTANKDRDRADEMGFKFSPWYSRNISHKAVIVDGSSAKNYKFHSLGDPDDRARATIAEIERLSPGRPIIYRPKPSYKGAHEIDGAEFARKREGVHIKDLRHDLERAHAVITYSSAICYDAACFGVPSIVLGDAPAKPISSTSLDDIDKPYLATDEERQRWLSNLAWCQFKIKEYADGTAWKIVREMVDCTPL